MSDSSIMSVREMIDSAFGERETNTVHFKLIQTILYILARQLRLLERRVTLVAPLVMPSASSLSIREVKIKASVKKKKRILSPPGRGITKSKQSTTKGQGSAAKAGGGKSTAPKMPISSSKLSSDLTTTSSTKTSSDPTKTSSSKTTSDPTKTSSSKTTTEPTQSSSSKTTSDPTKSSSSKTTSDPTKSSSSKTTSDPTKSSSSKTTSDPTKSSSSKTTSDPTKSSSSKTTSEPTQSSSSKTTSDPTQSSSSKTTSDPTKSSSDKTTSDPTQSSSSKTTSDPTKTSTSTKSTSEPSSSMKTSTEKSSSSRTKSTSKSTSSDDKRKTDVFNMLETVEEQRERELRTIHQRADSHEEAVTSPAPMASLDEMEVQYEKLLVVERVPSEEAKSRGRGRHRRSSEVSIVTQAQFEELASIVREIQNKFGTTGRADFPENAELMQELRRGASLTDAMAALQLSARLEAAEKTLNQMISLVTDLATRKGISLDFTDDQPQEAQTPLQVTEKPSRTSARRSSKSSKSGKSREASTRPSVAIISTTTIALPESITDAEEMVPPTPAEEAIEVELKQSKIKQNLITAEDLDYALRELSDGILKAVGNITTKTTSNAEQAYKTASKIEQKLNKALDLGNRMEVVETIVSKYVEQINIMDTNLSSQMTNYQEQLTQMQHELESGLEAMAESMANSGGDTVAVAELNAHFTDLQVDFDNTHTRQKELEEYQDSISLDLQELFRQIELLRERKSDRDEVADALRDKAGLGALNGLVALQQFNAVRGDFEKRIGAAYDKFNNQEIIWQKAIDDLLRELHEKADIVQVMSLRDDIQNNLDKLGNRVRAMLDIVGEPRSAGVARKIFRDSNCLSCSTPANMNIEELNKIPKLPEFKSKRPPTIGAEDESKPKDSGDYICYPGLPVRHPIDERAHICRRYCGGSHTMVPSSTLSKGPKEMIITKMPRSTSTALGTDGKVYHVDELVQRPCTPCNPRKSFMKMPEPSEADTAPQEESDMIPWDYKQFPQEEQNLDVTPPPPSDGFD